MKKVIICNSVCIVYLNFKHFTKHYLGQTRLTDMGMGAGGKGEDTATVTTTTTLKGSMGERISKALGKVEEKKKKRAQRRAQVMSQWGYIVSCRMICYWS